VAAALSWLPLHPAAAQQAPQDPGRRSALERAAQRPSDPTLNLGGVPIAQTPGQGGGLAGPLTQLDISMDLMFAFGSSTERNANLLSLQGGAHDPRQRGFTLQQAEIQMNGAVDPYFRGQFVLVTSLDQEGETIVELEEAWLLTQQLPANLQMKAGHYLTEFGRLNAIHPHAWDFQDQPVVLTRFFGADSLRAPGARLSWLAPTPTYLEFFLGAQNASGETLQSFLANDEVYEERPVGGRLLPEEGGREFRALNDVLWHGRIATAFDFDPAHTFGAGVSALFGPNATGNDADTTILGADFMFRWRPVDNRRGYPFLKLQGEFLTRAFEAAEQLDDSDPGNPVTLPGEDLDDYGGYLYAIYGFDVGWAFGLRGEYCSGRGSSYLGGGEFARSGDPFRSNRLRVSPMLSYQTSEYSRMRLQYNYDDADHLDDEAHSVWLGFEILIGPHQPHAY
jgi:hypothetical protein